MKSKQGLTYKSTKDDKPNLLPYKYGFIEQVVLPVKVVNGCVSTIRDRKE
jgi:hypothetical protein